MVKKLSCIVLSIILVFASCLTVQAATATAILTPSSSTVKPGDTFTVTLSINCADGINGATGITYSYDTSILELVSSGVNDTNFMNIGDTTKIDLLSNSSTKITTSNIYVFNFKVKEGATAGKTATISTSTFSVDSDAASNSEATIEAKSTTITVASSGSNGETTGSEGTGTENPTKPSQTETPASEDKKEETPSTNEKTSTSPTKSNTQNTSSTISNKALPKTGLITGIGITIVLAIGIAVFCYIRYKRINI